jgi:competence protein ComEA
MFYLSIGQRLAVGILTLLLFVGGALLFIDGRQTNAVTIPVAVKPAQIYIHVCGAVQKPGVMKVTPPIRKFALLAKAGGALPGADLNRVNLAEFAEDGEQVYVPKIGEIPPETSKTRNASRRKTTAKNNAKLPEQNKPQFPLDLNRAIQQQLEAVPGIGPVMAKRIIDYRSTNGLFSSYEDLKKVGGLGAAKVEKFRPYLAVR